MKTKSAFYSVLLAGILISLIFSCSKKEAIKTAPSVTLSFVTNITPTTASSGGMVTADGGATLTARGVCWSTSQNPTISDSKTNDGLGSGNFSSALTGLTQGTTYYLKAYGINSIGTGYSDQTTFTTLALAPVLTTTNLSAITATTAAGGGNVTNDGGSAVTARGVCWSTNQNPTISDGKTSDGSGTGIFTSSITGLTPGATYYIRAYATNSIGTSYGNQVTSTALATGATLTTTTASAITASETTSGGNITNDGGAPVTARGVCWSISQNPSITDNKTTDGSGTGTFTSSITGLIPGATYYIRAYATNSIGTSYGNQVTATALATNATLTTTTASSITASGTTSGGNITSDGGAPVIARGICWSANQNPVITDSKTTDGTGTGTFVSSVSGLTPGATYYIRAYATNSVGTSYGNQVITATLGQVPTTSTGTAINITNSSVTLNGVVNANYLSTVVTFDYGTTISYGSAITATQSPVEGNTDTNEVANIIGLQPGTTYHYRIKAVNSLGTSNSSDMTFTTFFTGITGTVNDIDGNIYNTIGIGSQIWMAENLKTTKYNDGTAIPYITDDYIWGNISTPAYCLNNNDISYNAIYGPLYNWYSISTTTNGNKNVCPTGWHIPTDEEWTTLTTYLGGTSIAGAKLKEAGLTHWATPNTGATNESGFTGLPGGMRSEASSFVHTTNWGYFWSSTENTISNSWYILLNYNNIIVYRFNDSKTRGYSIRCIKD